MGINCYSSDPKQRMDEKKKRQDARRDFSGTKDFHVLIALVNELHDRLNSNYCTEGLDETDRACFQSLCESIYHVLVDGCESWFRPFRHYETYRQREETNE